MSTSSMPPALEAGYHRLQGCLEGGGCSTCWSNPRHPCVLGPWHTAHLCILGGLVHPECTSKVGGEQEADSGSIRPYVARKR